MADSWSRSVFSEMVSDVGWDPETEEILVTFKKGGKTAAYKGFDEGKAVEIGIRLDDFVGDAPQDAINGRGIEDDYGTGWRWRGGLLLWHFVSLATSQDRG